jgi:hypothetical protein
MAGFETSYAPDVISEISYDTQTAPRFKAEPVDFGGVAVEAALEPNETRTQQPDESHEATKDLSGGFMRTSHKELQDAGLLSPVTAWYLPTFQRAAEDPSSTDSSTRAASLLELASLCAALNFSKSKTYVSSVNISEGNIEGVTRYIQETFEVEQAKARRAMLERIKSTAISYLSGIRNELPEQDTVDVGKYFKDRAEDELAIYKNPDLARRMIAMFRGIEQHEVDQIVQGSYDRYRGLQAAMRHHL